MNTSHWVWHRCLGSPTRGPLTEPPDCLELVANRWHEESKRRYEELAGDVSPDVKKLLDWTKPTDMSIKKKKPQPPILQFDWGGNPAIDEFKGYLESVTATYTMFNKSGKPIRAKCSISLKSVTKLGKKAQNPSSGSLESRRSHMLIQGESLHSIAYAEYGLASYWRALAAFNNIDDPMRLRPGSRILLPTAEEAASLS